MVLLSYDVPATNRSAASRVAHLIFGRNDASEERSIPYVRRAGVVWIGQSVFLMPRAVAEELAERLQCLGAAVATAHVTILPAEIESLRRARRSGRPRKHVDGVRPAISSATAAP